MSNIFIPYISQETINHKYFIYRKANQKIADHCILNTGLYDGSKEELKWIYSIIFEPLLLYDKVYITEEDFYYLLTKIDNGVMREFLSEGILKLVDTKSFRFLRSYKEKSNYFMVDKGNLGTGFSKKFKKLPGGFKRKIRKNRIQIDNQEKILEKIIQESNKDLKNSEFISHLSLNKKEDIRENNYKANRIFYMNYFAALQSKLGIDNLYQDKVLYDLLKLKISMNLEITDAFKSLLKFEEVLDIGKLILNKKIMPKDILEIRNDKSCKEFRKWINSSIKENNIKDSQDMIRAYHQACLKKGKIEKIQNSIYYKTINIIVGFLLSTTPIIGGLYSVFDNYKDLALNDWKPNFFINDIRNRN